MRADLRRRIERLEKEISEAGGSQHVITVPARMSETFDGKAFLASNGVKVQPRDTIVEIVRFASVAGDKPAYIAGR